MPSLLRRLPIAAAAVAALAAVFATASALTGIGGHATTAFGTYRVAVYARDASGYRTVRVRTWPF
jgi:ABC-type transporter Mla subunit MlaD